MNRVIKAQLALEEARKEMGGLLDLEERADDWTDKVGASKARILAAQSELEAAALLEPEPHEKRETTTPEDRELRSLHGKASVGRMVNDLFHNRGHRRRGARAASPLRHRGRPDSPGAPGAKGGGHNYG